MINSIQTVYKNITFRSRLEARWAVFFDELNINWQYEPEGFYEYGIKYLPDFALYGYHGMDIIYCEVKPIHLNSFELKKARIISKHKDIILCIGPPAMAEYTILTNVNDHYTGIFEYDRAEGYNRFFVCSGYTEMKFNTANEIPDYMVFPGLLKKAVIKSNRFNFNKL